MEHIATNESTSNKCCRLAAALRLDATRATMPGFADKLIRGAEDLERLSRKLLSPEPDMPARHH